MRPSGTVARAALTAVLAIGALPGLVGSSEPSQDLPIDAAAFSNVDIAKRDGQGLEGLALDAAGRSDGALEPADAFLEPAFGGAAPRDARTQPNQLSARPSWSWKAPRYTLTGEATFYDNGTTAMRLPRGTVVVICGAGGCIERVITDYGPAKAGGRILDLYRPDFFTICGCGWWAGTTQVTVRVY